MSETTPEPAPKLLAIGQLSWTPSWLASVQKKLGDRFHMDENGSLTIEPDTDQGTYNTAAAFLLTQRERSMLSIRLTNRMLGELILNYAATFSVNWTDAIEALGIGTERNLSSLRKLPRICSRIAADVLDLDGLTHAHYDVACSFSGPVEPDEQRKWNLRIRDILMKAAECPEDRPSKWVGDSIRALQKEFGIMPQRPVGAKVLLDQYVTVSYILEHWTDDQYQTAGQDRRKILDLRDDIENELINRNILTIPDATNFVPPWKKAKDDAIDVDIENLGAEEEEELEMLQSPEEPPPPVLKIAEDEDLPSLED